MSWVLICTSDSNVIRNNYNILVRKRKLKHLAKLAQCGEFDCVFLSCHIRVLERIFNLQLFECEGTSSSKQARHLTLKWPKRDSNPQLFSSWTNTQPFSQTGQIRWNWQCILTISHTRFRRNLQSVVAWRWRNSLPSLFQQARYLKFKWLQRDSNAQPLSS